MTRLQGINPYSIGQKLTDLSNTYLQPSYFQRSFSLGIPSSKEFKPLRNKISFLASALPLVSLYSPAAKPLSYAICSWNALIAFDKNDWWNAARSTAELAATYFEMRAALFLHTSLNLCANVVDFITDFKSPTTWVGFVKILRIASDALYLLTLIKLNKKDQWKFTVASLAFQGTYQLLLAGRQAYILNTLKNQIPANKSFRKFDVFCKTIMCGARVWQAFAEVKKAQSGVLKIA